MPAMGDQREVIASKVSILSGVFRSSPPPDTKQKRNCQDLASWQFSFSRLPFCPRGVGGVILPGVEQFTPVHPGAKVDQCSTDM